MHVITQKRIWEAKAQWPNTATALDAWYRLVSKLEPKDFAEMKRIFPSVDKVGDKHVFDIGGNKLRLIATVDYRFKKVFIRAVLDHKEYDRNQWK
jgi:mRNA interferase HigB